MSREGLFKFILMLLLAAGLAGCAGERAFKTGENNLRQARYDEAVAQFAEAVEKNPDSSEYRMKLFDARNRAALDHLGKARELFDGRKFEQAIAEYRQVIILDPSLETATQELQRAQEELQADQLVEEARQFVRQRRFPQAKESLDQALLLEPEHKEAQTLLEQVRQQSLTVIGGYELETTSTQPITLKFKDAKVKDVFKILSNLSGITFIFDEEIDAKQVSIELEGSTFSQALELLLKMNELSMRVLNPKTVILYPKTKDKEKQYEDQIIQTFYLSNIDAKKAVNLLRTMLQLRKVYVHEELNAIVIRDTPQVIKLAQKIIEAADRGDAEVVFDLELVAISGTDIQKLGTQLSTYSVGVGLAKEGAENIVGSAIPSSGATAGLLQNFDRLDTFFTLPSATFELAKTLSSAETLANPKLRVKNKGKAKIHVGTREPVVTTTTGTDGNITSTNIQYVDVGTKLDVEPEIQLDASVRTKLSLEVSQVLERIEVGNGNIALQIQTTNAQTELSLKDGERTVLGGLLQDNNSTTKTTIPFLGDIPFFGDLFSHHDTTDQKREILLSITPHIVKQLDLPKADVASIWSGGEDDLQDGPSLSSFAVMLDAEQAKQPPAVVPANNKPIEMVPPPQSQESQLTLPREVPPAESTVVAPPVVPVPTETTVEPPVEPAPTETTVEPPVEPAPAETTVEPPVEPAPAAAQEMTPEVAPAAETQPQVEVPVETKTPEPQTSVVPEAAEVPPVIPTSEVPEVAMAPQEVAPVPVASKVFLNGPVLAKAGEQIVLTVRVADVNQLFSAPLFITYDANLLEFERVAEGEFMRRDGAATVFTTSPNPAQGRIIVGYKQAAGGKGASGSGDLYQLIFTARQAGKAVVNLDRVNFRDPTGKRLTVAAEGTLIDIR